MKRPQKTSSDVYIPPSELWEEAGNHPVDKPSSTGTERILFVDDDQSMGYIVEEILTHHGYTVTVKTDSREALELFRNHPSQFDLVITDMSMPGLMGDVLALNLQKIRPDIPIIMCSGFPRDILKKYAGRIGLRGVIQKPFRTSLLTETIRTVLDDGAQQRAADTLLPRLPDSSR